MGFVLPPCGHFCKWMYASKCKIHCGFLTQINNLVWRNELYSVFFFSQDNELAKTSRRLEQASFFFFQSLDRSDQDTPAWENWLGGKICPFLKTFWQKSKWPDVSVTVIHSTVSCLQLCLYIMCASLLFLQKHTLSVQSEQVFERNGLTTETYLFPWKPRQWERKWEDWFPSVCAAVFECISL